MRTQIAHIKWRKGQALVEMAIILPLLLLLVLGIFEFGRAMYIKNTLTHAARAGARAGVVTPGLVSEDSDTGCNRNEAVFKTACNNLYSGIKKSQTTVLVQVFAPSDDPATATPKTTNASTPPTKGDTVKVTVTYNGYKPIIFNHPWWPGVPTALSGNNAMRYE